MDFFSQFAFYISLFVSDNVYSIQCMQLCSTVVMVRVCIKLDLGDEDKIDETIHKTMFTIACDDR